MYNLSVGQIFLKSFRSKTRVLTNAPSCCFVSIGYPLTDTQIIHLRIYNKPTHTYTTHATHPYTQPAHLHTPQPTHAEELLKSFITINECNYITRSIYITCALLIVLTRTRVPIHTHVLFKGSDFRGFTPLDVRFKPISPLTFVNFVKRIAVFGNPPEGRRVVGQFL